MRALRLAHMASSGCALVCMSHPGGGQGVRYARVTLHAEGLCAVGMHTQ